MAVSVGLSPDPEPGSVIGAGSELMGSLGGGGVVPPLGGKSVGVGSGGGGVVVEGSVGGGVGSELDCNPLFNSKCFRVASSTQVWPMQSLLVLISWTTKIPFSFKLQAPDLEAIDFTFNKSLPPRSRGLSRVIWF